MQPPADLSGGAGGEGGGWAGPQPGHGPSSTARQPITAAAGAMGRARARGRGRRGRAAWVAWAAATAAAALALVGSADAQRSIITDMGKVKEKKEFKCNRRYTPDEAGKPLVKIPGVTWMSQVQAVEMEGNTKPFIFFRYGYGTDSHRLVNNLEKHLTLREIGLLHEATPFNWVAVDGNHCAYTEDFDKYIEAIPKEDTAKLARAESVAKMAKYGRGKNYLPKILITDMDLNIQRKLSVVTVDPDASPLKPYRHVNGVTIIPMLKMAVSKFKLDHWDGVYNLHKKEEEPGAGAGGVDSEL